MPDIFDGSKKKPSLTSAESIQLDKISEADDSVEDFDLNPFDSKNTSDVTQPTAIRDVDDYSEVMRRETSSNNSLKSFVAKPTEIFFDSQHSQEKVLLLLRRHPVTQVGWIITAIFLAILPFLFSAVGLLQFLPSNYQFAATIGWYLLIIGFSLESFLSWFYNVYITTDERIIDVDFYNLLYKNISAAKIDNIEDITTEAGGVLASVFNFGTVKIQTAGSVTEFDFEDVPQPAKVTAFLNEMLLEEEREQLENRTN